MITKTAKFSKPYLRDDLPQFKPGDTVRVYQKFKDSSSANAKEKTQAFEGIVIARKHGKGISATFTVRAIIDKVAVEKIFPLHSPTITKIEVLQKGKVRRAKLYYLRNRTGKKAKVKKKEEKRETKTQT